MFPLESFTEFAGYGIIAGFTFILSALSISFESHFHLITKCAIILVTTGIFYQWTEYRFLDMCRQYIGANDHPIDRSRKAWAKGFVKNPERQRALDMSMDGFLCNMFYWRQTTTAFRACEAAYEAVKDLPSFKQASIEEQVFAVTVKAVYSTLYRNYLCYQL
jgi:hypothetical protein